MKMIVTGSIAYDYLMSFPGKFTEQILPEHLHRLSVSFLVDTMDKRRGGCAPNIAYTLALLGEKPYLMATAGEDFGDYRQWLEAAGVNTSLTKQISGKFTASFFCSTDTENNQIASFYTGAMADAGQLSFRSARDAKLAIISPNDPGAMVTYAEECRTLKIPFIFDPGQQCSRMSGDELKDGIAGAHILICNDYEFELIRQKTEMGEKEVLEQVDILIVTKGEKGSYGHHQERPDGRGRRRAAPDCGPNRRRRDALRGGLTKGLPWGLSATRRRASVASRRPTASSTWWHHSYTG
jgi:adenosine kinase